MKNLDRLDFTNVYNLIGRLRGVARTRQDKTMISLCDYLKDELDLALGYIDIEPKTQKEFMEDHLESERYENF